MKITASSLIRWAGLAAMGAGIIFAGIQPIHPADVVSSITTSAWAIITTMKTVMTHSSEDVTQHLKNPKLGQKL